MLAAGMTRFVAFAAVVTALTLIAGSRCGARPGGVAVAHQRTPSRF